MTADNQSVACGICLRFANILIKLFICMQILISPRKKACVSKIDTHAFNKRKEIVKSSRTSKKVRLRLPRIFPHIDCNCADNNQALNYVRHIVIDTEQNQAVIDNAKD